jgi:hypothetical protein
MRSIVGARAFHGNPYDGHTLHEQLEQATILMQGRKMKQQNRVYVVDHDMWSRHYENDRFLCELH